MRIKPGSCSPRSLGWLSRFIRLALPKVWRSRHGNQEGLATTTNAGKNKVELHIDIDWLNRASISERMGRFILLGTAASDGMMVVRRHGSRELERWHPRYFGMELFDFSGVGDLDVKLRVFASKAEEKLSKDNRPDIKRTVRILVDQATEMMSHAPPSEANTKALFIERGKTLIERLRQYLMHGAVKE